MPRRNHGGTAPVYKLCVRGEGTVPGDTLISEVAQVERRSLEHHILWGSAMQQHSSSIQGRWVDRRGLARKKKLPASLWQRLCFVGHSVLSGQCLFRPVPSAPDL